MSIFTSYLPSCQKEIWSTVIIFTLILNKNIFVYSEHFYPHTYPPIRRISLNTVIISTRILTLLSEAYLEYSDHFYPHTYLPVRKIFWRSEHCTLILTLLSEEDLGVHWAFLIKSSKASLPHSSREMILLHSFQYKKLRKITF